MSAAAPSAQSLEIATVYISVVPSIRGLKNEIEKAFSAGGGRQASERIASQMTEAILRGAGTAITTITRQVATAAQKIIRSTARGTLIKDVVAAGKRIYHSIVDPVVSAVKTVADIAQRVYAAARTAITRALDVISQVVRRWAARITRALQAIWRGISATARFIARVVSTTFRFVGRTIARVVEFLTRPLRALARMVGRVIWQGLTRAGHAILHVWRATSGALSRIWQRITEPLRIAWRHAVELAQRAAQAVARAWTATITAITRAATAIRDAIARAVTWTLDHAKAAWQRLSALASRLLAPIRAAWDRIAALAVRAAQAVVRVWHRAVDQLARFGRWVATPFVAAWRYLLPIAQRVAASVVQAWNAVRDAMGRLASWTGRQIRRVADFVTHVPQYLAKAVVWAGRMGHQLVERFTARFPRIAAALSAVRDRMGKIMGGIPAFGGKVAGWIAKGTGAAVSAAGRLGSQIGSAITNAAKAATVAIGAVVGSNISRGVDRYDIMQLFPRAMENMGVRAEESVAAITKIREGLVGLPTAAESVVSFTQRLAPVTKDVNRAADVALAFNNLLIAGGKSNEIQASAMEQFSQMFSVGEVDTPAWRSVMQAAPGQIEQLAKAMIGADAGAWDLYSALKEGTFTFEDMNDALLTLNKEGGGGLKSFEEQAKNVSGGIKNNFANMRTAVARGVEKIITAIGGDRIISVIRGAGSVIESGLGKIADFISKLSFDSVSSSLPVLGGVVGLLGAMASQLPVVGGLFSAFSLPVGVVVGLVAAMVTKSEALREALGKIGGALGAAFQGAGPMFSGLLEQVGTLAGSLGDSLADGLTALTPTLTSFVSSVLPLAAQVATSVLDVAGPLLTTLGGVAGDLVATLLPALQGLLEQVIPPVLSALETVGPAVGTVAQALGGLAGVVGEALAGVIAEILPPLADLAGYLFPEIAAVVASVTSVLGPLVSGIGELIALFVRTLAPHVQSFAERVMPVIRSAIERIVPPLQRVIGNLVEAGRNVIPIVSDVLGVLFGVVQEIIAKAMPILSSVFEFVLLAFNKVIEVINAYVIPIVKWLWENVVKPVVQAIGAIFGWLVGVLGAAWEKIRGAITAVYLWFKNDVVGAFRDGAQWVSDKFTWLKEKAGQAWEGLKGFVKPVADWFTNTVQPAMATVGDKIKGAFESMKDGVKKAWEALKEIAARPINFILGTVYNDGIRWAFNKIAETVGFSTRLPEASPVKFAEGGVLPGYTPGRDVHRFVSPTGGVLDLSGGEAIMVPEWTRAVGGPAAVAAMNHAASRGRTNLGGVGDAGRRAFADGGVWGGLSTAWDSIKNGARVVWNIVTDPVGAVIDLIQKPAEALLGSMDTAASWAGLIRRVPSLLWEGFKNFFRTADLGQQALGVATVEAARSRIGSPYVWGAAGPDTFDCSGLVTWAMQSIGANIPRLTASGFQSRSSGVGEIIPGDLYFWGGSVGSGGAHHVALAVEPGRIIEAPRQGLSVRETSVYGNVNVGRFLFDQGGYIQPGVTVVENRTGKPEPVLTSAQWERVGRYRGTGVHVENLSVQIDAHNVRDFQDIVELFQHKLAREIKSETGV
ncbi:MAG: tape measure protein [Buchananella hordeovulneris]|nr:tape measure protein [Buchananella hordeovulneris]